MGPRGKKDDVHKPQAETFATAKLLTLSMSSLRYILARWAHRKFKSLRRHPERTRSWLNRIARRQPSLFAQWNLF
jgi:hypothetical protein